MIFRRYLLRELFSTWALWISALTLILFSVVATRTFRLIDVQSFDIQMWLKLFGVNSLRYLSYLLSIAIYLALFNTSSRYWNEGEIWLWRNAGLTPSKLLRQLMLFILPMTLVVCGLIGWAIPWSYHESAVQQLEIARTPFTRFNETGQFLRFPSGMTIQIEGASSPEHNTANQNHIAHSVFVFKETETQQKQADGQTIPHHEHSSIWATSAELQPAEERVALTLKEGILKQYSLDPITHLILPKIDMHFNALHYQFSLPPRALEENPKWMSLQKLWSLNTSSLQTLRRALQAERFWRFSFPLHVILMSWMAWSLGRHNSRAGQSAHILSLILLDQLYLNLINLVQSSLDQGKWHGWGLIVGILIHLSFGLAASALWLKHNR